MRRFAFEEQDAPVDRSGRQRIIESANRELDPVILAIDVGPAVTSMS